MGYFLVMIIFCVIAVMRAKNGKPWIWFAIGAVLQLLSLLGLQKRYSAFGLEDALSTQWITYLIILAVSALLICVRKKAEEKEEDTGYDIWNDENHE
ncbi:MAG: hypothetical protein IJ733_07095 [Lachnospiraceae bacterium]|nr:hypothetical protein [Lachnospiraceae bacterium]